MQQEPDFQQSKRPRFDPTVNLGHIISGVLMASGLATMWVSSKVDNAKMDSRISVLEISAIKQSNIVDKLADSSNASQRTQDKLSLTLDYLAKRVESKP